MQQESVSCCIKITLLRLALRRKGKCRGLFQTENPAEQIFLTVRRHSQYEKSRKKRDDDFDIRFCPGGS